MKLECSLASANVTVISEYPWIEIGDKAPNEILLNDQKFSVHKFF